MMEQELFIYLFNIIFLSIRKKISLMTINKLINIDKIT